MGTPANPGSFDPRNKIAEDEPIFILRANDPLAPVLVRRWAMLAAEAGADQAKVADATRIAFDMERYRSQKVTG